MSENPPGTAPASVRRRGADDRDPHDLIGRTIGGGRYTVEGVLGVGGMGVVYLARQAAVDRVVAVKVLMPEMVDDESLIKRFHLEAKAASQLTHPNTITIHDFGREGRLLYIVMEYLEGQSLQRVLKREDNLGLERTCRIISQACASLAEAHAKSIIHRDIKPDNIFLKEVGSQKDFVKVLDFGVAKLRDPSIIDATITQAGMIFGTPKYMSPEQAKAKKLDGRSDLYALGVVAYECLMGAVPFMAEDPVSILIQHVHDPPPPFKEKRPDLDIPEEFEAIVMRALEKNRQDRYPSADVMREAFDGYFEKHRLTALTSGAYPISGAPYAGGYPTPSGPMASTSGYAGPMGTATPSGPMGPPPTGPMGPSDGPGPTPGGAMTPSPVATPSPVGVGSLSSPAAHAAETMVAEMPKPKRKARDFRDFGPALEDQWVADLNLGGGSAPGTQLMKLDHGNRGLLVAVLVLGLLLLGGVGFLIYRLTNHPDGPEGTPRQEATDGLVPGAGLGETPEPGTTGPGPTGPGEATPPGQTPTPGGGPVAGPGVATPPGQTTIPGGETPPAGEVGPGAATGPIAQAPPRLRVRIDTRPSRATLDFGDRRVEPDPDADGVYLIEASEGDVLEFRASADGYRSRDVSETLEAPADDGLYVLNVRLHREHESSDHQRDPCVDPRTGLRDPYCNR